MHEAIVRSARELAPGDAVLCVIRASMHDRRKSPAEDAQRGSVPLRGAGIERDGAEHRPFVLDHRAGACAPGHGPGVSPSTFISVSSLNTVMPRAW